MSEPDTVIPWKPGTDADDIVAAAEEIVALLWGEHHEWDSDTINYVGLTLEPLLVLGECETCHLPTVDDRYCTGMEG